MKTIRPELRVYIEESILPRYDAFDAAHRRDHAEYVISEALSLSSHYDVDLEIVYCAAACHDLGLSVDRKMHHLESGRIIRSDGRLREWFTEDRIELIAQAAEDHRASSDHEPRSVYGRLIAEADRQIDGMTILRRTIQFGLAHYPELDRNLSWQRTLDHLHEKYDYGGYLKLWIPESSNSLRLEEFRRLIADVPALRVEFDRLYDSLVGSL